jgi:hypothetical protein
MSFMMVEEGRESDMSICHDRIGQIVSYDSMQMDNKRVHYHAYM